LDAGNSASYPGSGSTWTDLSGNGNNGTLVNGVTYSSSNGGLFDFDGVNDYISIPINLTNTTYTIMGIARYKGTTNSRVISSNSGNWLMGWWGGQTNKYYAEGWVSSSSGGVAETNWICYAATGNQPADSWELYRNGVSIVGPNANGVNGPNGIRLGGHVSSEFSACQVSYILAYNRVLTAQEIQQNFDVLKSRFGL
jgi:hypothetical protein